MNYTPLPLIITLAVFILSASIDFFYGESEILWGACTFLGFMGGFTAMGVIKS